MPAITATEVLIMSAAMSTRMPRPRATPVSRPNAMSRMLQTECLEGRMFLEEPAQMPLRLFIQSGGSIFY
ncbi:hypothetical protein GCM10007301_08340 [Azorhizobium oxalatiphilum]|uniref:Uncharacterized protein n=1 Tax=Azorhizobium oxalatiphilum TaxID=980631 RepID=A0A917BN49_9HYPH|nr:hypothetical protein GCM10007301_08340 [Azorhizobium oxalatiphilum]